MITVFCDGSIRPPNPGGTGYTGWVAKDLGDQVIHKHSDVLGSHPLMSNNVAEYMAVASALRWLIDNKMQNHKVSLNFIQANIELIQHKTVGMMLVIASGTTSLRWRKSAKNGLW